MRNATSELRTAIQRGEIDRNQFTEEQLIQISKGLDKIEGFTWHHNSQSSPKNMQLIPTPIHKAVQHSHSSGIGISAVYNPVKVFKDNFGQQAEQGSATGIIGKIFTAVDAVAKTGIVSGKRIKLESKTI